MTSPAANWRLERLSASARETAEIASLGAGLSLSAWLTRVINDACASEGVTSRRDASTVIEFTPDKIRHLESSATRAIHPVAAVVEPLVPRQQASPGTNMLSVAALIPAGLGARSGNDTPEALVADIAKRGVRQALLVRPMAGNPERYEIVSGHRRWRVAQRIGLARIPANICTYNDGEALLASLGENLALGDLPVLDEAQSYLRLLTRCAVDMSAITQATRRDRQHVVRAVRLLGLPQPVRQSINSGALSSEYAFLLLDAANPEALAEAIAGEQLSVEAVRQRLSASRRGEAQP
jgi:ParB family transcriptional regulator, chromosome partitioning protein